MAINIITMKYSSLKVNEESFNTQKNTLTGREILELANLIPAKDYELLLKTNEKGYEPIQLDEKVDLTDPGIENFKTKLYKSLNICIDDNDYEVNQCNTTPKELLQLAGYSIDNYYLTQIRGENEIGYKEQNDSLHKIELKNNSKFCVHPRELPCVIVNAANHAWNNKTISFEEVINLAFGSNSNANFTYTVTYTNGVNSKPTGSLVKGQKVNVKSKMVFDAQQTNKS
jgi:hypothetical protein